MSDEEENKDNFDDSDEEQEMLLSVKIGKKLYRYKGPPDQQITDLFEVLKSKSDRPSSIQCINYMKTKLKILETWFEKKCRIKREYALISIDWVITLYDFLLSFAFLIVLGLFMRVWIPLSTDSKITTDDTSNFTAQGLLYYSIFFTIYGMIVIHIRSRAINLTLFLFLIVLECATFYYLYTYNYITNMSEIEKIKVIYVLSLPAILFINWYLVGLVFNYVKKKFGELYSFFCGTIYCVIIPYLCFTLAVSYLFLTDETNSFSIINSIVSLLAIPVCILFLGSWSILHYKMFALPLNTIQQAILRIKEDILLGFKKQNQPEENQGKCTKFWKKHIGNFMSTIMGTIYLATEYYLIIELVSQFSDNSIDPKKSVILLFLIVAVPIYVIMGIYIAASSRRTSDTFLFIPLFLIGLPLLGLYPLSQYMLTKEETKAIAEVILYGPPISCTLWLFLSILGIKNRVSFLTSSTFVCVFISFPIGVLYPLSKTSYFTSDTRSFIQTVYQILVAIGLGIIFLGIIIKMFIGMYHILMKKKRKRPILDLRSMAYWNLQSYGFMANATGFVAGYAWLVWIIYNSPIHLADGEKGYLLAMLVLIPFIFILINCALRSRSLQIKSDKEGDDDDDLDDQLDVNEEQLQLEEQEKNKKLKQMQFNIIKLGFILPIAIFLPLSLIVNEYYLQIYFLVLMGGIPISFLYFWLLTYVKNYSEEYQNFFTPCLVGLGWCLCILPFGIILPVFSGLVNNDSEEYGNYMRTVIGGTTILCMIGVTAVTMFIHIILNKIEFERKMKFIIGRLQKVLADNSYRSDNTALARLYLKYIQIDSNEKIIKLLQNQKVPVTRIIDDNKNFTSEYRVVTDKMFKKLTRKQQKGKKKAAKKTWMVLCLDIFCCRIGMNEEDSDSDSDDNDIMDMFKGDDARDIIDDFFPKDFKYSIINNRGQQTQRIGIMGQLERKKEDLMMEEFIKNNANERRNREDVDSSLTQRFKVMKSDDPNNIMQNQFKYTSHGVEMENQEEIRIEFYHDVWDQFSNNDDHFPSSIIYNDWLQLMRLSNIYDPEGEDTSFLDKETVIRIYDSNATAPWKYGILVLTLDGYSNAINDLAREIYPTESESKVAMKAFCIDILYTNLLHNLTSFAVNYRANVRMILIRPIEKEEELKNSPFYNKLNTDDNIEIQRVELNMINPDLPRSQINNSSQVTPLNSTNTTTLAFGRQVIQKEKKKKAKKPCHKRCLYSFCRCMRKCYCIYPSQCMNWVSQKIVKCFEGFFGQKEKKRNRTKLTNQQKKPATSWDFITREMIEHIVEAEEEYEEIKKKGITYNLKWNIGNIVVIFSKFNDLFTICLVAFSNNISWYPGMKPTTEQDTAKYAVSDGSIYNNFTNLYFACLFFSFMYSVLAKIALPYASRDEMGQDKDGNKAGFPHPQFFLTKSLQLLGGTMFMLIMRTFLDTFICVWEGDAPWYLYRDQNIVCLSNNHILMMIGAIIGLASYYPVSTFMFPNFQFQDKALDIKYNPTFLVAYIQAKLLILGITSFFKSYGQDTNPALSGYMQLGTAAFCMFSMAILNVRIMPCLVGWVNILETSLYMIAAILNGTGLAIAFTGWSMLGPAFALPMIILIIAVGWKIYDKRFRIHKKKKKNQIINEDLPQIEITQKIGTGNGLQFVKDKRDIVVQQFNKDGNVLTQKDLEAQKERKKRLTQIMQEKDERRKTLLENLENQKQQKRQKKNNKKKGKVDDNILDTQPDD